MIRHDAPSAISRIAYIKEDGEIVPDGHEFTMFDIDDICDRAVKTIDAIWDAREVRGGHHAHRSSERARVQVLPGDGLVSLLPEFDALSHWKAR